MSYKFEWYNKIKSQKDFTREVNNIMTSETGFNYDQLARLFYEQDGKFIMIELQIPTKEMLEITEENEKPWMDAYEVKSLKDYDASKEIDTSIGNDFGFTFENTEQIMLEYAKSLLV